MRSVDVEPVPKQWSRAEYQRLGEFGLLTERVELVEGAIVRMSPQNVAHTRSVSRGTTLLVRLFGDSHYVRVQCALFLGEYSEPEPDFALVPLALVDGPEATDNPSTADLVIEVSDSSLTYDRGTKLRLYASAQIPEYWIVNLRNQTVEVYRNPRQGQYDSQETRRVGDHITPLFALDIAVPVSGLF